MLVDALEHTLPAGATESTVLGPFYAPGAPLREYGANLAEESRAASRRWSTVTSRDTARRAGGGRRARRLAERAVTACMRSSVRRGPEDHLRGQVPQPRLTASYAVRRGPTDAVPDSRTTARSVMMLYFHRSPSVASGPHSDHRRRRRLPDADHARVRRRQRVPGLGRGVRSQAEAGAGVRSADRR